MFIETEEIRGDGSAQSQFHPELRRAAFLIPRFSVGPITTRIVRGLHKLRPLPDPPALPDISIRDEYIERPNAAPLRLRVFSPNSSDGPRPALLWMHGGGFLIGHPEHDQAQSIELCRKLGMVVAAVNYRLGPDHPFPEPLDDCYTALAWLHMHASTLNVDTARIAVGGASAGACLAAGLALFAQDSGGPAIAFQLLIYPTLDDRTTLRSDIDERSLRIWSTSSNRLAWRTYLGGEPGGEGVPVYAAPARRKDLSGLPPAWIGVGTCDLFLDENVAYASRLNGAGVPCTLNIVEGAFHAFDLVAPKAEVVSNFRRSYFEALQAGLCGQSAQRTAPDMPVAAGGVSAA